MPTSKGQPNRARTDGADNPLGMGADDAAIDEILGGRKNFPNIPNEAWARLSSLTREHGRETAIKTWQQELGIKPIVPYGTGTNRGSFKTRAGG